MKEFSFIKEIDEKVINYLYKNRVAPSKVNPRSGQSCTNPSIIARDLMIPAGDVHKSIKRLAKDGMLSSIHAPRAFGQKWVAGVEKIDLSFWTSKFVNRGHFFGICFLDRLSIDEDALIRRAIAGMDYRCFLMTNYWLTVSNHVRSFYGNICCNCGDGGKSMQVHHKTYENHGLEHRKWHTDLTCLCGFCHQKEHSRKIPC